MDPLNPFTFFTGDVDYVPPATVNEDSRIVLEEVEKDKTVILKFGKERLGSRYAAFEAYMRAASAKISRTSLELLQQNADALQVEAVTHACRNVLLEAAGSFDRDVVSYAALKQAVHAGRQQTRDAVQEMTQQFGRINIQQKLDEDPLWAYKRDKIAQNMATAQMVAWVAETVGEQTKEFIKWNLGCMKGPARQVLDFTKEVGKKTLDFVGLKEPVKKVVEAVSRTPEPLVQELDRQFGIPRELAEEYSHNALTATLTFAIPPTLKLAGGVTRSAAKGFSAMKNGPKAEFKMPKGSLTTIEGEFYEVRALPAPHTTKGTVQPALLLPPPVIKNPPLVRGIDIVEAVRTAELAAVKDSRALVKPVSMPEGLPKDAKSLFAHPEVEHFPLDPSEGFKVAYTTTGKSAIVLFEKDAYAYTAQQLAEIGRGAACEYLPAVFRDVLEFAKNQRLEQLYLAYDQNRIPLLTALKAESERITGMGSFTHHTGTSAKELTLLEMKFTPSMPMRYPEAIARDIDGAVTGKKSLNYLFACEEVGAEELLPLFPMPATQEELWKSVISRYNYPLTSSTAVNYLRRDPRAHIVRISNKERSYIVKDLLQTSEIATELQGNMFLSSLESPFIQFPTIVAAGRYTNDSIERGFLIRSEIPGQTLNEKLAHVGSFASGSQERIAGMATLWDPTYSLGRGLADIQTKLLQRNRSNLEGYIGSFEDMIDRVHDNLVDIGMNGAIDFAHYQTTMAVIKDGFRSEPGRSSCGLGSDISAGQFVCTEGNKFAIAFLDAERVTFNIGVAKQGIEPVANQYFKMHHMFSCEGLEHGLTLQEVKLMQDAFAQGYLKEYKGVAQDAASRFFDVYHSLDAIANVAEDIASGTAIPKEALGHLIGQLKEKLG